MVKNKVQNKGKNKDKVKSIKQKHTKIKHVNKSKDHAQHGLESPGQYKKELLEIDKTEEKFDRLFEQKLASQYREFRNMKEHHMQTKKFVRIFIVLMTIVLIALLLMALS